MNRSAESQAMKASEFAKKSKVELQKLSDTVIPESLNLLNEKYTDFLNNNERAKDELDRVSGTISRPHAWGCHQQYVRRGKKSQRQRSQLIGGFGNTDPAVNPVTKSFDAAINDAIAKNEISYERERQNILQKSIFNNQTFQAGLAQAKDQFAMNTRMIDKQYPRLQKRKKTH